MECGRFENLSRNSQIKQLYGTNMDKLLYKVLHEQIVNRNTWIQTKDYLTGYYFLMKQKWLGYWALESCGNMDSSVNKDL